MSELEDLKQQLYAKIQASQTHEQPPSEIDLLKYSQLPTYQAHQRLRLQAQQQWMESPQQGAIPAPANPLYEVEEGLKIALPHLKEAYARAEKSGVKETNYELLQALGDALTACTDALERIDDAPDEVFDVALEHLSPITGIAQPPESAF